MVKAARKRGSGVKAPDGYVKSNGNTLKRRLVASVHGHEKQGKTEFALSAPGPICYLNFDCGLEGVVEKFEAEKDIFRVDFDMECPPKTDKKKYYNEQWNKFLTAFRAALAHEETRTIVVDTETEAWETIRLAYFGKKEQVMPHHYAPVNEEYLSLLKGVYKTSKNLIFLRKMRAQYVDDKWNGKYEPAGFNKLQYVAQAFGEIIFDKKDKTFSLDLQDSRINKMMVGFPFKGEMCTFPEVAAALHENDVEEWL